MAVISRSADIETSPERAYNYLADVKNHADWGQHNLEVTRDGDGPIAVGSKWETVGHQFGDQPGTVTLTELVPNKKIVYDSDGKVGHFQHSFTIEPAANGSIFRRPSS